MCPIAFEKMLGYVVRRLRVIIIRTIPISSNGVFYVAISIDMSYKFIDLVFGYAIFNFCLLCLVRTRLIFNQFLISCVSGDATIVGTRNVVDALAT